MTEQEGKAESSNPMKAFGHKFGEVILVYLAYFWGAAGIIFGIIFVAFPTANVNAMLYLIPGIIGIIVGLLLNKVWNIPEARRQINQQLKQMRQKPQG